MIRVLVAFTALCFAGLFIQASMIHSTAPSAVAPDIILILTVILALYFRSVFALVGAFSLGILADFASGLYLGPNAAGCVIVFHVVGAIASRVYADRGFAVGLITFLCSLIKSLVCITFYLFYVEAAYLDLLKLTVLRLVFLEALFSGLVSPLVLKVLVLSKQLPQQHHGAGSSSSFNWWS